MFNHTMSPKNQVLKQVQLLTSRRRSRREAAMEQLHSMGPVAVLLLHQILDTRKADWRGRQGYVSAGLGCIGFFGLLLAGDFVSSLTWPTNWIAGILGILCFAGMIVTSIFSLKSPDMVYQGTAMALANLGDVRSLGRIVETYQRGDKFVHGHITLCLCLMLPQLSAADISALSSAQSDVLYKILDGNDVDLTLALLNQLPKYEAVAALPYVEKLAEGRRLAATNQQVKSAAELVLPILRSMANQRTDRSTLLRAGSANMVTADSLLRPAGYSSETDPKELLRAEQDDE
jgi:hypothetical protein